MPDDKALSAGYFAAMGDAKVAPTGSFSWLPAPSPPIAIGTCATWGGIPAAAGNITGSMSLMDYLGAGYRSSWGIPVINVPGCAPQGDNFTETVAGLLHWANGIGPAPQFDELGRPGWIFDQTVHRHCPKAGYYEEGVFAHESGDNQCLVEIGCWGPVVQCNIVERGAQNHIGGCMVSGGACIGCTMPGFPDKYAPFYKAPPGLGHLGRHLQGLRRRHPPASPDVDEDRQPRAHVGQRRRDPQRVRGGQGTALAARTGSPRTSTRSCSTTTRLTTASATRTSRCRRVATSSRRRASITHRAWTSCARRPLPGRRSKWRTHRRSRPARAARTAARVRSTSIRCPGSRGALAFNTTIDHDRGEVTDASALATIFRGYENILEGRDPSDAIFVSSRICGACGSSHAAAAASALEMALDIQAPPMAVADAQPAARPPSTCTRYASSVHDGGPGLLGARRSGPRTRSCGRVLRARWRAAS